VLSSVNRCITRQEIAQLVGIVAESVHDLGRDIGEA